MADDSSADLLLQDIAWLKRLATMLASDRDDADDLVQEALIAAWRRQPDTTQPIRGWLTKVLRDLAGMKHRSDRRRATRDARAEGAQSSATPEELLAQVRLHSRLAALVIELDEPYRSTVIGRFVEGRTSASIAQSLGIPAGTVRKRLHEALSRLRAGLDANAQGRTQWAPAVLAFAHGGVIVAKPIKLILVVLAALLLGSVAALMIIVPMRGTGSSTAGTTGASSPSPERATSDRAALAGPSVNAAATDAQPPSHPVSEHRIAMLAALERARAARDHRTAARAPTPGAPSTPSTEATATTLDIADKTGDTSDWQKRAHGTLNVLLGQCYDLGRAEDAALEGTLAVRFTLVGEPDVGGLLESVEILDGDTTITQQTVRDCVTQQLYALELDPPPDGMSVARELHLKFP